jgi:hypothetical protein
MAQTRKSLSGSAKIESHPKNTRQGCGKHTKYAASSRNNARKPYRKQGK